MFFGPTKDKADEDRGTNRLSPFGPKNVSATFFFRNTGRWGQYYPHLCSMFQKIFVLKKCDFMKPLISKIMLKRKNFYVSLKRNKKTKKSQAVVRTAGPYPPVETLMPSRRTFRTELRYSDQVTLDAAAGSFTTYVFSANGLFDPNVTGTGHQPRGFDQIMAMYDLYQVIGSKIYVEFFNSASGGSQEPCLVSLIATNQASIGASGIFDMFEQPNQITRAMAPNQSDSIRMSLKCDPSKLLGYDHKDGSLKGAAGSNPVQQVYYTLAQASSNGVAQNPGGIYALVTIIYDVIFSAEKNPVIS